MNVATMNGGSRCRETTSADSELNQALARRAIRCLTELLTSQEPGTVISAEPLGAMMMLIQQAGEQP